MGTRAGLTAASRFSDFVETLYRDHSRTLAAYIRRQFGAGPPDPEDIVQEAFARLAARTAAADIPRPEAFLKVTARNIAIDAYRNRVGGGAVLKSVAILQENDHEIDVSDVLCSRHELERLAAIVDTLKPRQRAAFLLHRIDGLSFVEIAEQLHVSPSGARMLVKAALATCVARMKR